MKYFLNKNIEKNNFVAINKSLILVGSCISQQYEFIEKQLAKNKPVNEIFSIDKDLFLPYDKIVTLSDEIASPEIELSYKVNGSEKKSNIVIPFANLDDKIACLKELRKHDLPCFSALK